MDTPGHMAARIAARREHRKRRIAAGALLSAVALVCALCAAFAYMNGLVSEKGANGAAIAISASFGAECPQDASLDALVETEGGVDGKNIAAAKAALSLAPTTALERMLAEGWKVVITSERDLSAYVDLGDTTVNAVTVFDEKRIYIATAADAETVALHEVAHWMDREAGGFSSSGEWEAAYEEEKPAYAEIDAYAASSKKEALAEMTNALLLGREKDAAAAPKCAAAAYGFIESYTTSS